MSDLPARAGPAIADGLPPPLLAPSVPWPRFHCEAVPERDRVRVVATGELDIATVPALERTIRQCSGCAVWHVVLDLRPMGFISVAGLRLILRLDLEARRAGRGFSLIPGPPAVQRLFHITRIYELLEFESPTGPS